MAVLLGLLVAVTYGTGDFLGGLASRRVPVLWVVFLSHALAAVLVVAVVALDSGADPQQQDIIIGAVAGIVGMVSVALFYQGLALGRMGVVAPVTAVVSAIVPVAWGLAFGERPSALALLGVALAVGSVALISSQSPTLDHAPETKSTTPLLARDGRGPGIRSVLRLVLQHHRRFGHVAAARVRGGHRPALLALVFAFIPRVRRDAPTRQSLPLIAGTGVFDAAANAFFLLATSESVCCRSSARSARCIRRARCCSRVACCTSAFTARSSLVSGSRSWAWC